MNTNSTKPYLIRSIYEWCMDSGFTPYVSVKAYSHLDLPKEYVKNDEIVFNIGNDAVQDLVITNEKISFMARFNGVPKKIEVPIIAVQGIFAKEVNQGMAFSVENETMQQVEDPSSDNENTASESLPIKQVKKSTKPTLRIIK